MSANSIFISGGQNMRKEIMDRCFELNLDTMHFDKKAAMSQCKGAHGIIKLNSWLYVFGGWCGRRLNTAERYYIDQDIWQPVADMPIGG